MANEEIVSLVNNKIPSVVSYDAVNNKLVIGETAKAEGLSNHTNIFNFKMDLGAGDKEFREKKQYWYAVTTGDKIIKYERFTAKEVIKFFLAEVFRGIDDIPDRLIIGEPAVRDQAWRENFKKHLREVLKELGFKNIDFFFEPFAVFQYYRHYEKQFPVVPKSEIILVVDIGGGTFNSCIIQTKSDGNLSRGGANMLPLGLQGEPLGGSTIDLELLKLVIEKARKRGIFWKDDPVERVKTSSTLFRVEDAKIRLSEQIPPNTPINKPIGNFKVPVTLPKGTIHQDEEIVEELTGEDLKSVIRKMWRRHYGEIVTRTINEAGVKLGTEINKIDRVIVAGGSSKLPFTKEEIAVVLPTLVNKDDVYIGNDLGNSVAYGIACECRELVKTKKYHDLTAGRLAPCLLNDLYICFKKERKSLIYLPNVNDVNSEGRIFSAPFETRDARFKFTVEMPFEPGERLFYYFSDRPFDSDSLNVLNVTHDVISIPSNGKVSRKIDVELEIKQNGSIKPIFRFRGKGSDAKKDPCVVECPEIFLDELNVKEGDTYIGVDFGTSNSYIAKLFCSTNTEHQSQNLPELKLKKGVIDNLRKVEIVINDLKASGVLSKNIIIENAKKNKLLMIFHSNKIEGNPLTKGETQDALDLNGSSELSTAQKEAKNLDQAFEWVAENLDSALDDPEAFIRNINKIILDDVKPGGGAYRSGPVTLAGMDFIPPPAFSVPVNMKLLADEIKKGPESRSTIEYVTNIHAKLVMLHPFIDGNGRTTRLYMNALLLFHGLPAIIVNFDDKQRYFDALVDCNKGDLTSFVTYVMECVEYQLNNLKNTNIDNDTTKPPRALVTKIDSSKYSDVIGDRLAQTLQAKFIESRQQKEKEYQEWCIGFNSVIDSMESLVNTFNSIEEYRDLGIVLKLMKYDMLLFDKYEELSKGNSAPRTWYFRLDISTKDNYEKIMFFFQPASIKLRNVKNASSVSLGLARFDGTSFRRIELEPVQLLEIGLCNGKLVCRLRSDDIRQGDLSPLVGNYLVSDILVAYC